MNQDNSVKNFSYIGVGRIVTIGLHALFYLLFAALLDPEIYGELSFILSLASTFSIISLLGLNVSLQVYQAKKTQKIFSQIITLFLISTTIAALILLFIEPIAALLCVTLSFFAINQGHLLGLKLYKKFMIYAILKSGTFLLIPIVLYFVFDIYGVILGMAISNLIGSLPIFRNITVSSLSNLKNHYKVLIHNFGVASETHLPVVIDKLAIAPLFGLYVVGIYQFNLQIFVVLSILPWILSTYLITEESSGVRHKKLSYLIFLASILVVAITIVLAPILVPVFYPKYSEGITALQILVISVIPLSLIGIFNSKLLAKESTKVGFSAIIRIGSLLLLIAILGELLGLIGLSIAVLLSVTITMIFLYVLYRNMENKARTKPLD